MKLNNSSEERYSLKKFLDALLLREMIGRDPAPYVLILLFVAYLCWLASPYLMLYAFGMPDVGTAPRYVGTLRIVGETRYSRHGSTPPRYYVSTTKGNVEFHCGVLISKTECFYTRRNLDGINPVEVGSDPFWGIDFIKFPTEHSNHNRVNPEGFKFWREAFMRAPYQISPGEKAIFKPNQYWVAFALLLASFIVYVSLFLYLLTGKRQ